MKRSQAVVCEDALFSTNKTHFTIGYTVPTATGYGLGDQGVGVQFPVEARIFCSPCRPDRLWGPTSILSNGYRGLFSGVKAAEA
jgi:hypothetical protein